MSVRVFSKRLVSRKFYPKSCIIKIELYFIIYSLIILRRRANMWFDMLHLYRSSRRFRVPRNSGLLPKSVTVINFLLKITDFFANCIITILSKFITLPQLSCQTTVRKRSGKTISISKGCKQTEACVNNALTNPVNFWTPPSCTDQNDLESGVYEKIRI